MVDLNTSLLVEYDLLDTTAVEDAVCTTADNNKYGDINLLPTGSKFPVYGTYEHNFFVLDGTIPPFTLEPKPIAFFSSAMSNADGKFTKNPTIDINFTLNHSTVALGLHFADYWPFHCKVTWKTLEGSILMIKDFDITKSFMLLDCAVSNYGKITIEFTECLPKHNIKLELIDFGKTINWNEETVMSGTMTEEVNMVCDKISVNKLNFQVYDSADTFNLGNKDGYHQYIQKTQSVRVYENLNKEKIFMGEYFVDKFTDSLNTIKFDCISLLGLMDNYKFIGGKIYHGELAGNIIDEIMTSAKMDSYEVEPEVRNIPIYGLLKPMKCRDALAKVLFACQAVVDDSRSDKISIFMPKRSIGNRLGINRKISTKVTKKPYVSGITLNYAEYSKKDKPTKVASGIYPVGDTLIEFKSPYVELTTSVGTIVDSGYFYCILHLDQEQSVQIDGVGFDVSKLSTTIGHDKLKAGELENIKEYKDCLVNYTRAKEVAQQLLKYHELRLAISTQYLAAKEKINSWCIVENPNVEYNNYIAGYESINTDLTKGFVATGKLVGYYDTTSENYFTGKELYAKNNIII